MAAAYAGPRARSTEAGTSRPRGVGAWRRSGVAFALLAVVWLGCGASPRPGPSAPTRQAVARAEAAESRRAYDEARQSYAAAVAGAPDDTSRAFAARRFGRALIFWGELEAGRRELERAAASDGSDAGTWHDLAMVRFQLGDGGGAELAFRRAIEAAPGDPRPRIALAAMLWKLGEKPAALREYRALTRLELSPKLQQAVRWAIARLEADAAVAPGSAGAAPLSHQP